jgi:hypothetical protein
MKKVAYVTVYWGDEYGKPPKTSAEKALDEALAKEILKRIEQLRNIKIAEVSFDHYHLEITGDEAFCFLMEILQPASHLVSHTSVRVWRTYSRQELGALPVLLWRFTNQAIEDDWYDLKEDGYKGGAKASHKRCPACRAELEQVRDLLVDVRKMGKRDVSLTYGFEVILSARLAQTLQESGLTGFTLRPVWDYRKPNQGEPRLFQLIMTNVLPPMASPPTEFEGEQRCGVCGTESRYIKHTHYWGRIRYYEETSVYYPKEVLETAADFNRTTERFGDLSASDPYVIISQRAYRWLREQNVRGWEVEPVYLVE